MNFFQEGRKQSNIRKARLYRGVTRFGPPMWQAEADTELTLYASPATAVGQSKLTLANLG